MTHHVTDDLDQLLQRDVRNETIPTIGSKEWVTVYDEGWYSALVPNDSVAKTLFSPGWDIQKCDPAHAVFLDYEVGHTYGLLSDTLGIEPLVLLRSYGDVRPDELELSEDYRLFHNLFYDRGSGQFLRITKSGAEELVGRIEGMSCKLRLRDLRQYLAIRRMHLAVYFQIFRVSSIVPEELPVEDIERDVRDPTTRYHYGAGAYPYIGDDPRIRTFSKTVGKKFIAPFPLASCGIWPYESGDSNLSFIIGTNVDGRDVEHSCDPDQIPQFQKDGPSFLTPVFFRREVLQRYFSRPSLYSVEDGLVRCASMWMLRIDNDLPGAVSVALGDLAMLPSSEQLHWRAHNVPPDGATPSTVSLRRTYLAEFADGESADHVFKSAYNKLHDAWESHFGRRLFRPLHKDDEHCLASLRRLLAEEQSEFDEQVGYLTKLLVDRLNEAGIQAQISDTVENERGIAKLERWFAEVQPPKRHKHLDFLKALQAIRSAGAAHGKGSNYEKLMKRLTYYGRPLSVVFEDLLVRAAMMLTDLREWAEAGASPAASCGASLPTLGSGQG